MPVCQNSTLNDYGAAMGLEATIIWFELHDRRVMAFLTTPVVSVDNSEWMRNGDYTPTRLEAEIDAVNLVAGAKTQQNAERYVCDGGVTGAWFDA